MKPDYNRAAIKAAETLVHHKIGTTPVDPLPILKTTPGVFVLTFEEMSNLTNVGRSEILDTFGCQNQDAATTVFFAEGEKRYIVTYNKLLSSKFVDRALARELGHIVLGHDGSRPEEVRDEEARCFAHHLLVPRALIHAMQATNIRLTVEMLGSITGCYDYCLSCMRKQPPTEVPAELNRQVRDQFMPYIKNLFGYIRYAEQTDNSATADFGLYMNGYEE